MAFENTSQALRQVGGLVTRRLSQNLQEDNSIASGKLDSSIAFRAFSTNNQLGINIEMEDYWVYVDEGRKAGRMPPVSKIEQWLSYPNVRSKISQGNDAPIQNVEGLAYVIAKKIGREGTKGNDFATNVFESSLITKEVPALIESAIGEDLEEIFDKAFEI